MPWEGDAVPLVGDAVDKGLGVFAHAVVDGATFDPSEIPERRFGQSLVGRVDFARD